jgi:hypothetical protein
MWLWCICAIPFLFGTAWAKNIDVTVQTVLASQDEVFIDPGLSNMAKELQSLFRYSSYRLLGKDRLNLALDKTGSVVLPGQRVLKITPTGTKGDRVELKLVIHKKNRQVFETVIQLLNRGSIIVGGPKHKQGSLLFNISAAY